MNYFTLEKIIIRVRERGHENFSDEKLDNVMKVAKQNSPRAYAMVQLLF